MTIGRALEQLADTRAASPARGEGMVKQGIGGYRIERLLGRGGMGMVYEATQISLKRRVALKFLCPEAAGSAVMESRFRREALLQAALDHPHILEVYETGLCDAGLFIAMRLVRGETLRAKLADGPLEPAYAMRVLRPIADALDTAHACGVVHRDVKPQNILVGAHGHAYLADFGLVRRTLPDGTLTEPGSILGTPRYLAPELLRGGDGSPASDIYAFAAVVRESLPEDACAEALHRGLAYDPRVRPATASELMEEVGRELHPPAQLPVPAPAPAASAPRRPRLRVIAAIAAVAATLCGLGVGALLSGSDQKPVVRMKLGAPSAKPIVDITGRHFAAVCERLDGSTILCWMPER
jgi:serine/threonine protein kinase